MAKLTKEKERLEKELELSKKRSGSDSTTENMEKEIRILKVGFSLLFKILIKKTMTMQTCLPKRDTTREENLYFKTQERKLTQPGIINIDLSDKFQF